MERHQLIERSIIKKYRKTIWNNFVAAIKDYQLIKPGDKIGVCISGGKDSMLLAKCMQHLQKYSDFEFSVEYIVMDPGYHEENRPCSTPLFSIPFQTSAVVHPATFAQGCEEVTFTSRHRIWVATKLHSDTTLTMRSKQRL